MRPLVKRGTAWAMLLLCLAGVRAALGDDDACSHRYHRHKVCFANGHVIDTEREAALEHHGRLRAAGRAGFEAEERVYVVHVGGALSERGRRAIETYAGVRLGGYLPHDAHLVTTTAYRAELLRGAPGVAWVDALREEAKVAAGVRLAADGLIASLHAGPDFDPAAFAAGLQRALRKELGTRRGRGRVSVAAEGREAVRVRAEAGVSLARLAERLAAEPLVHWVEPTTAKRRRNAHAGTLLTAGVGDGAAGSNGMWARGLHGEGQIVAVADGGLDHDHCFFAESYAARAAAPPAALDLSRSKVVQLARIKNAVVGADSEHGTHVAGAIVGRVPPDWDAGDDPAATARYNGIAYGARLVFQDINGPGGSLIGTEPYGDLFAPAYAAGARVHSDSWGCGGVNETYPMLCNVYDSDARAVDRFVWDHPDMLILIAGGNDGTLGDGTIGSPATCKNCLAVGAAFNSPASWQSVGPFDKTYSKEKPSCDCNKFLYFGTSAAVCCPQQLDGRVYNEQNVAYFSSRGPAFDSRIKPDVVAPGYKIVSALSDNKLDSYQCKPVGPGTDPRAALLADQGTSMACPVMAAAATLARQYFTEGWYPSGAKNASDGRVPSSTLLRAVLINGARPLNGSFTFLNATTRRLVPGLMPLSTAGPDKYQGFGEPVLTRVLRFADSPHQLWFLEQNLTAADQGSSLAFCAFATGGEAALRATLVWNDRAATAGAARALVNDLDLLVYGVQARAFYFPNGAAGPDGVNTVEVVDVPGTPFGNYSIIVDVTRFQSPPAAGPMLFTLLVTGSIRLPLLPGSCGNTSSVRPATPTPAPTVPPTPTPSPSAPPPPPPPPPTPTAGPTPSAFVAPTPTFPPIAGTSLVVELTVTRLSGGRAASAAAFDAATQQQFRSEAADALSQPASAGLVSAARLLIRNVRETTAGGRRLAAASTPAIAVRLEILHTADGKPVTAVQQYLELLIAKGSGLALASFTVPGITVAQAPVFSSPALAARPALGPLLAAALLTAAGTGCWGRPSGPKRRARLSL